MLRTLHIQNFRGFNDRQLDLSRLTLLVGRNNAGKSTIIEALRLVALAVARHKHAQYRETPRDEFPWIREQMGYWLSIKEIEFNVENLFYQYGRAPALIAATFDRGTVVKIYINEKAEIFCALLNEGRFGIGSRPQATALALTPLEILPQIKPVEPEEKELSASYVRRTASSALASSHFRNQLLVFNDRFSIFERLVEEHWPGVRIRAFEPRAAQLKLTRPRRRICRRSCMDGARPPDLAANDVVPCAHRSVGIDSVG